MAKPKLGDIVRPRPGSDGCLRSGCSAYDDAVVVRVNPFALVSRATDMLWSCTVARTDFETTGVADLDLFSACRKRITGPFTNRRDKRERRKFAARLGRIAAGAP